MYGMELEINGGDGMHCWKNHVIKKQRKKEIEGDLPVHA